MAEVSGGEGLTAKLAEIREGMGNAREVRVGFLENATYPDGQPVAMVAALNNYGAPEAGIPARPFFTTMIAQKSGEWGGKFAQVLKAVDYDTQKALELMGTGIADQLRDAIEFTSDPPNSPVTNLLKQRFPTRADMTFGDVMQARHDVAAGATAPAGKPLTWTGTMAQKVSQEVI